MGREKKIEGKVTFAPFLCWGKSNPDIPECSNCSGYERWRDCYRPQIEGMIPKVNRIDKFYSKFGRDWKNTHSLRR